MRIIHARRKVFDKDYAFENKMTLLVWILSVLKWKEYGNTIKLYCDNYTLENIKKIGFDILYDEIDSTYLEDKNVCNGINFNWYWAMPKLLALRHEVIDLGNNIVIANQDVVPMSDVSRMWNNTDIAVWSNKEYYETRSVYNKLQEISLPENYKLPEWFTGIARPLNTGILHIKSKEIVELFTGEALKWVRNNQNNKKNTRCQTMCNVEQRLLGEIVKYKKLTYSVMQPINQGLFNKNGFHTHGYKIIVNNENGLLWHLNLLLMIREKNIYMFNILLKNEMFKEEKEYFDKYGYKCEIIKELQQYKDIF